MPISTWREFLAKARSINPENNKQAQSWKRYPLHLLRLETRRLPLIKTVSLQYLKQHTISGERLIFHSPFHLMPQSAKALSNASLVRTVHDVLPISRPQYFTGDSVNKFKEALADISPNEHIICVSETARADLIKLLPAVQVDQIHAFPLAADSTATYTADDEDWNIFCKHFKISSSERLLLSVGTIEPRKNHYHLIKGFEAAIKSMTDTELRLVIAGGLGWHYAPILEMIANSGVRHKIIMLGPVPDSLLTCLYQKSLATLFVSWGEGFGLPVLESMQHGTPVIASSIPSLLEIGQDAAYFVDPSSEMEISEAIKALSTSAQLQQELRSRSLARARHYSWEKTVRRTAMLYHQIISK
jgi:glycosyltransferase involved in cell wall biosynthesis